MKACTLSLYSDQTNNLAQSGFVKGDVQTEDAVQVLVCGAELFTSNAALMPVAYYEKKATLQQVLNLFCISALVFVPLSLSVPLLLWACCHHQLACL